VRPVPQLEIPPTDDEGRELSPTPQKSGPVLASRSAPSPELCLAVDAHEDIQGYMEEPSDLDDARDQFDVHTTAKAEKKKCEKKATSRKAKGGYRIGKQVSDNFVSYKIRSKGQQGRGRFRGGRFRR